MKGLIRLLILSALITNLSSCVSNPVNEDLSLEGDSDFLADGESADNSLAADDFSDEEFGEEPAAGSSLADNTPEDDFSDFGADTSVAENKQSGSIEDEFSAANEGFEEPLEDLVADTSIEDDPFAEMESSSADVAATPTPEPVEAVTTEDSLSTALNSEDPFAVQGNTQDPLNTSDPFAVVESESLPNTSEDIFASSEPTSSGGMAQITDLQFQANENGGTIVVKANQPLTYSTRLNPENRQFIVEVDNALLPDKLKRTLNTRDIRGAIGAIDAYQNPGSSTARFVIQLREGMNEPVVQAEGSSILVIANPSSTSAVADASTGGIGTPDSESFPEGKILPHKNLSEFLAGNTEFYGKKISIEMNNMDIRDALALISSESGVNMVVAEEVKGTVSLKLRQVPWDQALVVLMKAKKIGYTRQGNVLRVAPLQDLQAEEDDATKLALSRRGLEPLKVRMFPVSYAKVDDLEKKIKDFLGERGKVVGDLRTSSLVVTDLDENLDRVGRLIQSLDTQPPQVLVESKIVEANETFTRNIGVSWNASGLPVRLTSTGRGPLNLTARSSANPLAASAPGAFNLGLSVGTLDFFGTLSTALAISESDENVKVISSPRIMTLSNEKAEIRQVTEVPVRQVTVNGNTSQETFTFKPLQLKLDVTPQITNDGSVIMNVAVMREFRGADVSTAGAGAFAVNSREAKTKVLVKNGQTAVIGGIYQSDAIDGTSGVPWIRKMPLIGWMFGTDASFKTKSELLVFLTPRVMGSVDSSRAD